MRFGPIAVFRNGDPAARNAPQHARPARYRQPDFPTVRTSRRVAAVAMMPGTRRPAAVVDGPARPRVCLGSRFLLNYQAIAQPNEIRVGSLERFQAMSRLDAARDRLLRAVDRLDAIATTRRATSAGEDERMQAALQAVRADYEALQEIGQTVRKRLDTTIERLETILER